MGQCSFGGSKEHSGHCGRSACIAVKLSFTIEAKLIRVRALSLTGLALLMSDNLTFMMGKFEATFPTDRQYSDNHLWLQKHEDVYRVGLTAYSVRLLQDVYFLDWTVDAGVEVRRKQEIGEVESSKALSSLYAPVEGFLLEFNEELLDDPSAINTDSYGSGWLYSMRTESPLLTAEEYLQELDKSWEHAQRTIKGQIN
jgi:glycine cleavage system H protein